MEVADRGYTGKRFGAECGRRADRVLGDHTTVDEQIDHMAGGWHEAGEFCRSGPSCFAEILFVVADPCGEVPGRQTPPGDLGARVLDREQLHGGRLGEGKDRSHDELSASGSGAMRQQAHFAHSPETRELVNRDCSRERRAALIRCRSRCWSTWRPAWGIG